MEEDKGGCGVDTQFGEKVALCVDGVVKGHAIGVLCEPCDDDAGGFVADGEDAEVAVGVGFLEGAQGGECGFTGAAPCGPEEGDHRAFFEVGERLVEIDREQGTGVRGGTSDETLSFH